MNLEPLPVAELPGAKRRDIATATKYLRKLRLLDETLEEVQQLIKLHTEGTCSHPACKITFTSAKDVRCYELTYLFGDSIIEDNQIVKPPGTDLESDLEHFESDMRLNPLFVTLGGLVEIHCDSREAHIDCCFPTIPLAIFGQGEIFGEAEFSKKKEPVSYISNATAGFKTVVPMSKLGWEFCNSLVPENRYTGDDKAELTQDFSTLIRDSVRGFIPEKVPATNLLVLPHDLVRVLLSHTSLTLAAFFAATGHARLNMVLPTGPDKTEPRRVAQNLISGNLPSLTPVLAYDFLRPWYARVMQNILTGDKIHARKHQPNLFLFPRFGDRVDSVFLKRLKLPSYFLHRSLLRFFCPHVSGISNVAIDGGVRSLKKFELPSRKRRVLLLEELKSDQAEEMQLKDGQWQEIKKTILGYKKNILLHSTKDELCCLVNQDDSAVV